MRSSEDAFVNYGILESMVMLERSSYRTSIPRTDEDDPAKAANVEAVWRKLKRKDRKHDKNVETKRSHL